MATIKDMIPAFDLYQPTSVDDALDLLDDYDWLKNRRIAIERGEETISGVGVGIAPDGALLFRPDRGALRRVTSGRVRVEGR